MSSGAKHGGESDLRRADDVKGERHLFPNLEERSAKAAGKQSQGDAKQEQSAKGIGKHHHTSACREPNTTIYLFIVNVLDALISDGIYDPPGILTQPEFRQLEPDISLFTYAEHSSIFR
jgi:hypothetical protein